MSTIILPATTHGNEGGAFRREHAIAGFTASAILSASLQKVLVDLIELHIQGKQAHWNVVGPNFRDLHLQLDEIVDEARQFSDTVAERMRALRTVPDGRSDIVAATTSLAQYPEGEISTRATVDLIVERLTSTVDTLRAVHDNVDAEDPTSSDLLHVIIASLEKFVWMLSAENRDVR